MRYLRLVEALMVATIFLISANICPAQRKPTLSGSSQGSVTVKLTVESSVGVVQDADGNQHVVVANGPAATDDSSQVKRIQFQTFRSPGHAQAQHKITTTKPEPH